MRHTKMNWLLAILVFAVAPPGFGRVEKAPAGYAMRQPANARTVKEFYREIMNLRGDLRVGEIHRALT